MDIFHQETLADNTELLSMSASCYRRKIFGFTRFFEIRNRMPICVIFFQIPLFHNCSTLYAVFHVQTVHEKPCPTEDRSEKWRNAQTLRSTDGKCRISANTNFLRRVLSGLQSCRDFSVQWRNL